MIHKIKSSIFLISLIFWGIASSAQNTLEGNVIGPNNKPVIGAKVSISKDGKKVAEASANDEGAYLLKELPDGLCELGVTVDGKLLTRKLLIEAEATKKYYVITVEDNRIGVRKVGQSTFEEMGLRNRRDKEVRHRR